MLFKNIALLALTSTLMIRPENITSSDLLKNITLSTNKNISNDGYPLIIEYSEFNHIAFYDPNNDDRYINYKENNPNYTISEIVWMVNSDLDKPFYTDVKEIKDTSNVLLVNKYNKLPDNYVPEKLVKLYNGILVTPETKKAFEQLRSDASSQNYTINAVSGYRSISYQKSVYNRYLKKESVEKVDTYSARSGYSEHHTGRALDLSAKDGVMENFGNSAEFKWIQKNAHKYGFIVRYKENFSHITGYKSEPWHITYVGTDIAQTMYKENIDTLEEYVAKYKTSSNH